MMSEGRDLDGGCAIRDQVEARVGALLAALVADYLYVRSERPSPLIWYPTYQTTCLAALKPKANGAKSRFMRRS